MEQLSKFSGSLHEKNELYHILNEKPPIWWPKLKDDKELYIEIRKNDIIDVYFNGGRLAEIKCGRDKKLNVTTHPKYLGKTDTTDRNYYREGFKNGHTVFNPIYQDCISWISNNEKIEELKRNVTERYTGIFCGENTSEKYLQACLILNGRDKYIDSEFAHRLYDNKRMTIRFDLVKIENDTIIFEELKRVADSRLRTTDGYPEIRDQMERYEQFLKFNAAALTEYYKTLYRIKVKLGLPVPLINDIDKLHVENTPTLLIINNYDRITPGRQERIDDIRYTLTSLKINYRIE